ncbi:MAG: electron transport complex subunit E [Anaeroplasmataceae bacterium]|jgi:electron transport complex, RnfABCDGE type, E subunit|nr:electron transport complex subunit E [Anaeroplasmataceae bacterium]
MEQTNQNPVKEKSVRFKTFLAGIIKENPVLVGLLGMCPTLATTKSLESAFGMGILVILTLIGSNVLISLLRKIIPSEVKIPCYIVIIATFVTIIKMFAEAFLPELYSSLGVFISLIVVNCIILGRAEAFASKNGPLLSLLDAIGTGLGFTIAMCIMGLLRELLGTGGLTFGVYFTFIPLTSFTPLSEYAIKLFTLPAGGFLTLGCILAVMAFYRNHKEEKKLALEKKRIEELKAKKAAELAQKKALEEEGK